MAVITARDRAKIIKFYLIFERNRGSIMSRGTHLTFKRFALAALLFAVAALASVGMFAALV